MVPELKAKNLEIKTFWEVCPSHQPKRLRVPKQKIKFIPFSTILSLSMASRIHGCPPYQTFQGIYYLTTCAFRQTTTAWKQAELKLTKAEDGKVNVENYIFDQELCRKELALMICCHEYPLAMVDHVGFRKFCAMLQPMFKVVCRNTIRKDILEMHEGQRDKLIKYFANFENRVAVTLLQDAANATLRSETLRETVCDAIIANGGVRKPSKMCKTFAMADASNMVQIIVACAMLGIWFSSINCLRCGRTKETGSQMKVFAMYIIQFTRMNCL